MQQQVRIRWPVILRPKTLFLLALAIVAFPVGQKLDAQQPETIPDGYRLEQVAMPEDVVFEPSGMDVHPETGVLYVATRRGDVWTNEDEHWNRFAEGFHDPTGLLITKKGHILVGHKPEVTRLIDTNKDGRADVFRSINSSWGLSRNYCEYTHGPVRRDDGSLFVTLNLSDLPGGHPKRVKGATMGRNAKYRGWAVRITPDGNMDPYAYGLRSPAGVGMSPADELFVTTNQGDFMPFCGLVRIKRDQFYGHPASLKDLEEFKDRDLDDISNERYDEMRATPVVWFPYAELSQSPGNPVWAPTDGSFGPFGGQIFVGDEMLAKVLRISLEKVQGRYQGAVFNFADPMASGALRLRFGPEGESLWVGQTDRGWPSVGSKPFALHRINYDGETVPFSMHHISLTSDGFAVKFTRPANRSALSKTNVKIDHWTYNYSEEYGSPKVDQQQAPIQSVSVNEKGDRARVTLDEDLETDRIYSIQLQNVTARNGDSLAVNTGYYTVKRLRDE